MWLMVNTAKLLLVLQPRQERTTLMVSMVPPSMFDGIVRHTGRQRLRVTVVSVVS